MPYGPGTKPIIDPETAGKFAQFFLARGGRLTAACLTLAAAAKLVLGIHHGDLDEAVTGVFYLSLVLAYGSLVFTSKRTSEMVATGIGEMKHENPHFRNGSEDPAINRVIEKIQLGQSASPAGARDAADDARS